MQKRKRGPDPIDVAVGARIKMQRRVSGMSQSALADGLGISFQQIQKYENGKNRVSSSRLQQIAALLKVPVSFFFDGGETTGRDKNSDYVVQLCNTFGGLELAQAFTRIKGRQVRRSIVDLVQNIADSRAARRS